MKIALRSVSLSVLTVLAMLAIAQAPAASWNTNSAANQLYEAIENTTTSTYTLTANVNMNEYTDGEEQLPFDPYLYKTFELTSNGKLIQYSGRTSSDETEAFFAVNAGGSFIFTDKAQLSGGYGGYGLIVVVDNGKLTFRDEAILKSNYSTSDGGAITASHGTAGLPTLTFEKGATFTSNTADGSGGAVYMLGAAGSQSILNAAGTVTFQTNKATNSGGAVYAETALLTFENVVATGNQTHSDGGVFSLYNDAKLTISGTASFKGNSTEYAGDDYGNGGGVIYTSGSTLTFGGETIFGGTGSDINSAQSRGGAIAADGSILTFAQTTTFQGNKATAGDGGAVSLDGSGATFGGAVTFSNNSSAGGSFGGGALYVAESTLSFLGKTIFLSNSATAGTDGLGAGGAVHASMVGDVNGNSSIYGWDATGTTETMEFTKNSAVLGGALYAETSAMKFRNTSFTENTSSFSLADDYGGGGAIYSNGSQLLFEGTTAMTSNTANQFGGAVFAMSTGMPGETPDYGIQFRGAATIKDNSAKEKGGAFYLEGSAILLQGGTASAPTTISGNKATSTTSGSGQGGAFWMTGSVAAFGGTTNISGNSAREGGAFHVESDADLRFLSGSTTTLTGNTATVHGGAINVADSSMLNAYLESNAKVVLEKGTSGNDIHLGEGAILTIVAAAGASMKIDSGLQGNETASLNISGAGYVSIGTVGSSFKGSTTVGDGGTLLLTGGTTFGDLDTGVFVLGDSGTGILSINLGTDTASTKLNVNEFVFGDGGKIVLNASKEGTFSLINVNNYGSEFNWDDYWDQIVSSAGIWKITKVENEDDVVDNLLKVIVSFDETAPWEFNPAPELIIPELNDPTKPMQVNLVNGTGKVYLAGGASVGELTGDGTIVLNDADSQTGTKLTVNIGSGETATFSGTIEGDNGSFVKNGDGTQELTGTNTYGGGTTVNAGTLRGNTDSLQGNIVNHATVEFEQTEDGTFNGTISGENGNVIVNGSQISGDIQNDYKLTFDSAQTYGGATTINSGWLLVTATGSINNSVITVKEDGGLAGLGSVGSVVVEKGGAIQAFESSGAKGSLTMESLAFNDTGYIYVIVGGDNSQYIDVEGVADISKATIQVVGMNGDSSIVNQQSRIVIADEYVGKFAQSEVTFTDGTTTYTFEVREGTEDGRKYYYLIGSDIPPPPPPVPVGLTVNQTQTKVALDTIGTSDPVLGKTIAALNALNPDDPEENGYSQDYLDALGMLAGSARANGLTLGMYSPARMIFNRLSQQNQAYYGAPTNIGYGSLNEFGMGNKQGTVYRGQDEDFCNPHSGVYDACCPVTSCFALDKQFWADVTHVQTNVSSDGNSDAYGTSRTGIMIGCDTMKMSGTRVGLVFGYYAPYLWQNADRVDADDYHLGLYLHRNNFGTEMSGYLGYAHQEYRSRRYVAMPLDGYAAENYNGSTSGDSFFASVELAKSRCTSSGCIVRPLLGLDYLLTTQQGYTEKGSGDGAYALKYDKATFDQLFLRLGVHLKKDTGRSSGVIRLQYVYNAVGDMYPESVARFAAVSGSPVMNIRGVDLGHDYFNVGTGLNLLMNGSHVRRLAFDYDFNVSKRASIHALSLNYTEHY